MKNVLYAFQGTGNGHASRALVLLPILMKYAKVKIAICGTENEINFPYPIDYYFNAPVFVFGKNGGIDWIESFFKSKVFGIRKQIKEFPFSEFDLIINDFEPISARIGKKRNIPVFSISHQAAFWEDAAPRPKRNSLFGEWVLKNYAPASHYIGVHFEKYSSRITTPIIRPEIRNLSPSHEGHISVYLPAYSDDLLISFFSRFPQHQFHIFSKRTKDKMEKSNSCIFPISSDGFMKSLISCDGVLCGAGFETPAEALFLGKKLFVIPMKGQYEQHCNAAALSKMKVPNSSGIGTSMEKKFRYWLLSEDRIRKDYPQNEEQVILEALGFAK